MKQVLYIDASPFFGGAQASLMQLCKLSASEERQMIIAGCSELSPDLQICTHHYGADLKGAFSLFADGRRCSRSIQRAIDDFAPDVIYLNGMRSALLLLAARLHPACSIMLHDRDTRCPFFLPRLVYSVFHPHIIAVSAAVAEKWSFAENRLEIRRNRFDVKGIAETVPVKMPFGSGDFIVVMAADFTRWKNHALLIDAVSLARQRCSSLRVILKGRVHTDEDGAYLASLKRTVSRLHLESIVFFIEENCSALPYIAAADCLAACSENEPFGRTVVEALACGKCIIAGRTSAAPEILDDCAAIKLADYTPDSFAEALLYWSSPARRSDVRDAALVKARQFE